ncbi:MAG: DMT family transporter [Candidatus Krumholzibacteriota bacterium]|nr:DMT family transporter [Candidatus Krumholzibacteriota bacterium]
MVLLFVIWSNSFTAIRHLREIFSASELVLARFLPFALFIIVYLSTSSARRRESVRALKNSFLKLILMGLTGVAGYNYFLYTGQAEIKPGAAALITTLAPLFTLILAVIFLREKVTLKTVLGIIIAFAGLYIVIDYGKIGMGAVTGILRADLRYALITALAPLCWSIYTIISKSLAEKSSPFTITCLSSLIGTLPFLVLLDSDFLEKIALMEVSHWIALAYLTLLCTLAGFWIWNFALTRLSATSVSSFIYLNPPLAALSGYFFFDEEVTILFAAGSLVLLAGLYLSQTGQRIRKTVASGQKR